MSGRSANVGLSPDDCRMNGSKLAFGLRLRAHRERRGISHEALAESLKIKRSLLTDLERGDVSRWPTGIYRRAIFREYVKAIGLAATDSLEEFCELFPETESRTVTSVENSFARGRLQFRLALAAPPSPGRGLLCRRLSTASADLVLVLLVGYATALVIGSPYWTTSGIVGLIWYPAVAVLGESPLRRIFAKARLHRSSPRAESPIVIVNHVCGPPADP